MGMKTLTVNVGVWAVSSLAVPALGVSVRAGEPSEAPSLEPWRDVLVLTWDGAVWIRLDETGRQASSPEQVPLEADVSAELLRLPPETRVAILFDETGSPVLEETIAFRTTEEGARVADPVVTWRDPAHARDARMLVWDGSFYRLAEPAQPISVLPETLACTAAGEVCNDGLFCTADDRCNEQLQCVGTRRTCDDGNSCTFDGCV